NRHATTVLYPLSLHDALPISWGEGAVRFRKDIIRLVGKRWLALTVTTIASHLALFFVLLLSLRYVGIHEHEVSWAQALAVFAFRSEEHTSELQSRFDLVCRLL